MNDETTMTDLHQPGSIIDPLTEIAREGARRMLAAALRAEATRFVAQVTDVRLPGGRQRVVRHGTGPKRFIQTGIGPIPVPRLKVRDQATGRPAETAIRFTSNILPRWARRSRSLDALLPVPCLRGVSTGDFQEALTALLGADAPTLTPGVISRLTAGWQVDYDRQQRCALCARRAVDRRVPERHWVRHDAAAHREASRPGSDRRQIRPRTITRGDGHKRTRRCEDVMIRPRR